MGGQERRERPQAPVWPRTFPGKPPCAKVTDSTRGSGRGSPVLGPLILATSLGLQAVLHLPDPPAPLGWGLFPCHSPRKAPSEDPLGYVFSGHPTHLTSLLLTHCHPHPGEPASVQSSLCLAPPSLPHRLRRGGLARCSACPDPAGLDELSQVQKSSRSEAAAVFRQRGRGAEAPSELLGLGGAALQWTSRHPPESWLTACPQMGAWGGSRPGQWGVRGQVVWV